MDVTGRYVTHVSRARASLALPPAFTSHPAATAPPPMSWVERKLEAYRKPPPHAKHSRIGRKEARLTDTYEYRRARQQVPSAQWAPTNRDYGSYFASPPPPPPPPRVADEAPRWERSSAVCGAHGAAKLDVLGAVDLSRERELHEKAVGGRRQGLKDRLEGTTMSYSHGTIHGAVQFTPRRVDEEAVEKELREKAVLSRRRPIRLACHPEAARPTAPPAPPPSQPAVKGAAAPAAANGTRRPKPLERTAKQEKSMDAQEMVLMDRRFAANYKSVRGSGSAVSELALLG
ncbi:hypothetical protein AB1Y20_006383 [Prymnesium parvum]|uniref:Ribosome biogenesis protein NOP53 n=1 Tax=Prymnesium parvum TaxID=97485 RepID=A0AB34J4Y4_PRYPA